MGARNPWPWRSNRTEPGGPARSEPPSVLDAALEAFETAILGVDETGGRLISGGRGLKSCAIALGAERGDAGAVLAAMDRLEPAIAIARGRLIQNGTPFDVAIHGPQGAVRVTGGVSGALAFIALSLAPTPARQARGHDADMALEAYPLPAWRIDSAGRIITANRAWLAAVEATDLASALERRLSLDSGVDLLARQATAAGEAREAVKWLNLPEGRRAMRVWAAPDGQGGAVVWTFDVTDARSAVRTAQLQDAALDLLLSRISDAVALFDEDRRLARSNLAFAALWDLEPAWLAERPRHGEWLDRLRQTRRLPDVETYAAFKAQELARHGEAAPGETLWRLPDGRTLRVASAPHPEGGLILVFSDITPQLALTTQFNHLLQVQQATLDKLTDAVAVFGADTRLKLHNEAFQTLWGLPSEALSPPPMFDDLVEFCAARLHDLSFWRDLKARIADLDPHLRGPAAGETDTGDGRRLAWQLRPLPDGATLVGFSDVTDARRIEAALRDRQAALAEAERLKHEFVATVSRELRTPLTTILGYAELLDGAPAHLPARVVPQVRAIRSAAADLARAVDDILDLAELDAREAPLRPDDLDIDDLLAAAARRWAGAAAEAGVELLAPTDAGTAGTLRGDGRKLAKVLDHLIDHALAQTPAGGTVRLTAARGPGEVSLRVSDTGPGIPYVVQARIFDRQSGEDGGPARLGLALVKGLVELHGGWVTVESAPGAGASFTCHLPEAAEARPGRGRADGDGIA